ncbi:MAG TPA: hypothetical protein VHS76_03930 [Steroidobacteraceae bacterium]|nr:hypothetical protein [Steroidobacteraceae bacterium]
MYTRSWLSMFVTATLMFSRPMPAARADNFHFPPPQDPAQPNAVADSAALTLDAGCRRRLQSRRVLFLVGEQQGDQWLTAQDRFQPLLQVIEKRLRDVGFMLYTPQQIKAGIAQAEIDAYFKNDPDGALAASKKLGANFVLRGIINSQAGVNPVVQVNEVAVSIDMALSGLDGRTLSEVTVHTDSYSGSDTLRTALALVKEQADRLVGQLAGEYCSQSVKH